MTPTRLIIDTDPGIDDALAFLLALASPEIQLEALTTTQGNVTLEKATRNALSVLELANASDIHDYEKTRKHEGRSGCPQEDFIELFLQRMETLSRTISG
jgi:inosine-uridine nucleoside N-ribohydrolase